MTHRWAKMSWMAIVLLLAGALTVPAQELQRDYDSNYDRDDDRNYDDDYRSDDYRDVRIDRYLDADVWTDRADGEYYEGDNVTIHFRVNRDAFVTVYSIDSRGRVNLLFPADPSEDNFVAGGVTYSLPEGRDNYDLVVSGPRGTENIQIVASRERFPIPNWYRNSGLVCDWDNRDEYMDDLNGRYFVRYAGQRFAYDRAVIFVEEWEPDYFRPVYYPYYPGWAVCGNVYIDYPWGGAIYVNGIYWGCAPLYIPRLLVGWHTITVYDHWGYCWENDIHISRYNTLVLNQTIIKTRQTTVSKYKEVRAVGYRDPVKHGYPDYEKRVTAMKSKSTRSDAPVIGSYGSGKSRTNITQSDDFTPTLSKKFVRGDAKVIQSERGIETDGSVSTSRRSTVESRNRQGTNSFGDRKRSGNTETIDRSGSDRDEKSTLNRRKGSGSSTTVENPSATERGKRTGDQPTIERRKSSGRDNSGSYTPTTRKRESGSTQQPSVERRRTSGGETRKVDRPAEQPRQRQPEAKPAEKKESNPPAVKEKPAPAPSNSGGKSKDDGGRGSRRGGRG